MSIIGIKMVFERLRGDERTEGCSIHAEKNWSENGFLRYTTSKFKGDEVDPEATIQKESDHKYD